MESVASALPTLILKQCETKFCTNRSLANAAGSHVDGGDFQNGEVAEDVAVEVHVIDADHFAPVDVNDLLVEEVALEEEHALAALELLPIGEHFGGFDPAVEGGDRGIRHKAVAGAGFDNDGGDSGKVVLGRDGDFADTTARRAVGVINGRAQQFRECHPGHSWVSIPKALRSKP